MRGARGANIVGWQAPDIDVAWYPIDVMRWAGVPVVVALEIGGTSVLAIVRRHGRAKRLWWFQIGAWHGAGWARREEIRLDAYGRAPPGRFSPVAWRPVDPDTWPHPLPAPLDPAVGPNRPRVRPPEPAEALDPHHGSDDWPYPGLALGLAAPKSREECEARILRAFRTSAAQARVGHGASGLASDIPSEMIKKALRDAAREREAEERRMGILPPLEAVRSGWTPTRRDLSDWWTALGWLNHVAPSAVGVVELRAADPPWSFRQIAEKVRVRSHNTARALYGQAIDAAFAAAQLNGGMGT